MTTGWECASMPVVYWRGTPCMCRVTYHPGYGQGLWCHTVGGSSHILITMAPSMLSERTTRFLVRLKFSNWKILHREWGHTSSIRRQWMRHISIQTQHTPWYRDCHPTHTLIQGLSPNTHLDTGTVTQHTGSATQHTPWYRACHPTHTLIQGCHPTHTTHATWHSLLASFQKDPMGTDESSGGRDIYRQQHTLANKSDGVTSYLAKRTRAGTSSGVSTSSGNSWSPLSALSSSNLEGRIGTILE